MKERFNEAYEYLHNHYQIFINEDLGKVLGYSRSKISLALQGRKDALTPKFLRKLCEKYPFFSYDYLMYGEGELLLPTSALDVPQGTDAGNEAQYTRTLFDLAMQVIKDNEALHRQLQASIAELRSLIDRYGPVPGAQPSQVQKIIPDYPNMVAEDLQNETKTKTPKS